MRSPEVATGEIAGWDGGYPISLRCRSASAWRRWDRSTACGALSGEDDCVEPANGKKFVVGVRTRWHKLVLSFWQAGRDLG